MGLDMYLKAEKYVGGWRHGADEGKRQFDQIVESVGMRELVAEGSPSLEVRVTVAYWRKANAVHAWFVREVAGGVDDCQDICVTEENLKALIGVCERAIKLFKEGKLDEAAELMAPKGGFFFGSTEVDEQWCRHLESTVAQLTPLLRPEIVEKFSFYYQASW